ncbi:tape measure protein [Bartonella apis]|uniref:tape measure protein n=1 Tax=Bartonella apis TaxID=1686310 RepID=UPI00242B7210|nr:tape measure protein [Bartonella apis]MCT6825243.1 tape measure protein [Bartonella apis]MCT6860958.1 tape measure protein [Bartonella apis]
MADIATLGIEVRSESLLAASQNLDRFAGVTQRVEQRVKGFSTGMTTMQGSVNKLSGSLMNAGTVMTKFSNALQILGIGVAVNEIRQYADSWTLMSNKIAAASQSSGMQARSLSDLKKDADNARSSIVEYADLYARIMRNSKGVAKSEQEVADATNIVSKAFAVGGAAASEQAAGVLQLGQALGSGVLQGDELRSIRENAPVLAQAIADEFGTTISGLKNLGAQGQLTSDRVLTAILNARQKIEAQFSKTSLTIEQSLTLVKNAATEYVGTMDSVTGASRAVSGTIKLVADNFDFLGNTVLAAFGVSLARIVGRTANATIEQVKLTAAVLEGNAVMLNSRTAALQKATAIRETAVADQQAAKAALDAANAERVRAVQALDSARAGQLAGVTHAQAAAQVATASRAVSAAQVDLAAKTAIADRALLSEQVAMAGATRSARILGSVMSVASKAMTFVGGPIGAGLLAVGSALYYVSQQAQQAQERSDRYSEAIRRAGTDTEKAKDLIKNAGRELFNIDGINTQIEAVEKAKQAAQDLQKIKEQMSGEILTYDIKINGNPEMPNMYEGLITDIRNLKKIAEDTKIPLSDLENAANQLGMQNQNMDGLNALLLKIIDLGKQARVAAGAMDSLNDKANSLDGQMFGPPVEGFLANQKMDEYVKKLNDFNALPKEERDIRKRMNTIKQKASSQDNMVLDDEHARKAAESELARDKRDAALKKSTHFSEREANAYRDLIKSGQDRVGQLELEAQVAGKAGIAADTLRMKLELEQKATDKGRVITAAKREEIDKLVVAYQKAAEAADKARLDQDMSYQWRQMGRSDIDKSVADTLKQYGLEENLNSIDAANIRLLETTKRNRQAWQQLGDTGEDTLYRMIAGTDSWRDSLASLMPTIKDLVLQLAGLSDSKYSLGGMLSNAFGGGQGNPILMSKYGGMTGLFAKGSAFTQSGQVKMFAKGSAFTNSIVTSPTPFRFADGDGFGKGIMGEAGPEAVMPLKRDARGTLGIAVNGGGRSAPAQPQQEQRDVVVSVEASDYFDVRVREIAQQVSQQNIREYHKNLPNMIGQTINEARNKNRM